MSYIGFIGIGRMGSHMVLNLLEKYRVIVYDINHARYKEVVEKGAIEANALKDIYSNASIIFLALNSGAEVESICTGKEGIFKNAKPGTIVIDCSSIDILTSRKLFDIAKIFGIEMLDAPMSGGVVGAATRNLTFMVGGSKEIYEKIKDVLLSMGKCSLYVGTAGNGQAAKICNNLLLAITMLGVSESLSLAEKLGLSPDIFYKISSNSSSKCWSMENYCPVSGIVKTSPSNYNFEPGFTTKQLIKDLKNTILAFQKAELKPLIAELILDLYQISSSKGNENLDFSSIIKLYRLED